MTRPSDRAIIPPIRSRTEAIIIAYRVSLDIYEGPLDVLLRLIEREELDITTISLARVADQYLAYIGALQNRSADQLADFIGVAARLLLIKSRYLLPEPEEKVVNDEEDVGADLARQLSEYRRYKRLASQLRDIEQAGRRSFSRLAPPPKMERPLPEEQMDADELRSALLDLLRRTPAPPPVDKIVSPVVVRMVDCVTRVLDAVRTRLRVRFSSLLHQTRSRLEAIVTFLAILEMNKQQRIRLSQERLFGEIYLVRREALSVSDSESIDLSEYGEDG